MSTAAHSLEKNPAPEPRSKNSLSGKGQSGGRATKNTIATVVMWAAFLVALVPLVWIIATVIMKGGELLLHVDWWTKSQRGVGRREVGGDRREHAGLPDVGDGRRVAADPRCPGRSEPRGGREVGHHAIQSAAAS